MPSLFVEALPDTLRYLLRLSRSLGGVPVPLRHVQISIEVIGERRGDAKFGGHLPDKLGVAHQVRVLGHTRADEQNALAVLERRDQRREIGRGQRGREDAAGGALLPTRVQKDRVRAGVRQHEGDIDIFKIGHRFKGGAHLSPRGSDPIMAIASHPHTEGDESDEQMSGPALGAQPGDGGIDRVRHGSGGGVALPLPPALGGVDEDDAMRRALVGAGDEEGALILRPPLTTGSIVRTGERAHPFPTRRMASEGGEGWRPAVESDSLRYRDGMRLQMRDIPLSDEDLIFHWDDFLAVLTDALRPHSLSSVRDPRKNYFASNVAYATCLFLPGLYSLRAISR